MFSQINRSSQLIRVLILLHKRGHLEGNVNKRSTFNGGARGLSDTTLVKLPNLESASKDTPKSSETSENDCKSPREIISYLIKKDLSDHGLALKSGRESLVLDFFNLTRAVMEKRLLIDEFLATNTFKELQNQLNRNIDALTNAQIISLLVSAVKMRLNPATELVKLLEHEVKFRMNKFNMNQIIKLLNSYNSSEMSSEQKQIADMLNHKIRSYIEYKAKTVEDFNFILNSIATEYAPSSLLGLVEEKLLDFLVKNAVDEDDMVSVYLLERKTFNYCSLCELFINIAKNKRRPTPILKAASMELSKLITRDGESKRPTQEVIISTLHALTLLNYTNRALISGLICDLGERIELDKLDTETICVLLRALAKLRFKSSVIMKKFLSYIRLNKDDITKIDHNIVHTFLHVAAIVNFHPDGQIEDIHTECMKDRREQLIDRKSRKWLNYVWSLAVLRVADESHIRSVLSSDFYDAINSTGSQSDNYADMMKLLNLRAIAKYDLNLEQLDCKHLDHLNDIEIKRNTSMISFASKVQEALGVDTTYGIHTPFGFRIDCELKVDENYKLYGVEQNESFKNIDFFKDPHPQKERSDFAKCALIFASYNEINSQGEVYGPWQMASRIMAKLGYHTIFLLKPILSQESQSADFANNIHATIKKELKSKMNLSI